MIFSCFVQKEKSDGFSKLFGAWNRRFLFLNMSQRVLYYSANPNSENHTEIKLRVRLISPYSVECDQCGSLCPQDRRYDDDREYTI